MNSPKIYKRRESTFFWWFFEGFCLSAVCIVVASVCIYFQSVPVGACFVWLAKLTMPIIEDWFAWKRISVRQVCVERASGVSGHYRFDNWDVDDLATMLK